MGNLRKMRFNVDNGEDVVEEKKPEEIKYFDHVNYIDNEKGKRADRRNKANKRKIASDLRRFNK